MSTSQSTEAQCRQVIGTQAPSSSGTAAAWACPPATPAADRPSSLPPLPWVVTVLGRSRTVITNTNSRSFPLSEQPVPPLVVCDGVREGAGWWAGKPWSPPSPSRLPGLHSRSPREGSTSPHHRLSEAPCEVRLPPCAWSPLPGERVYCGVWLCVTPRDAACRR